MTLKERTCGGGGGGGGTGGEGGVQSGSGSVTALSAGGSVFPDPKQGDFCWCGAESTAASTSLLVL